MRFLLELTGLVGLLLALLFFSGWWLVRLFLPPSYRSLEMLLAPLAGLFWIDTLFHTASWLGLNGRIASIALALLTVGLDGWVLLRRGPPRLPTGAERRAFLCALPALVLALLPVFLAGQLLPIGDTNGDPVSHCLMTEYLIDGSLRGAVPLGEGFTVWEPVYGKFMLGVRLGFHFVQAVFDLLSGRAAFETFSLLSAVGLFLAAQAVYVLARRGMGLSPAVASVAVLLTGLDGGLLWFDYGGFGPQVLGAGLFLLALTFWWTFLRDGVLESLFWASLTTAGLSGVYSEMLALLVPAVGLAALGRAVALAWQRDWARLERLALLSLLGMVLVLVLNPVGVTRAVRRYVMLLDPALGLGRGNVDWWVDLRVMLGLLPFGRYDNGLSLLVALPASALAVLSLLGMVTGLFRVPLSRRWALLSFVGVHTALQSAFYLGGRPYSVFKGWGYGLAVYLALLAAGIGALYRRVRSWQFLRLAVVLWAVGLLAILVIVSSVLGVRTADHFACSPSIAALADAVGRIPAGASVYAVTGDLQRVSVFWVAYFLREHPAHFDVHVIYTSEEPRAYAGEPYVLVHRSGQFDATGFALEPVWSGDEFDLSRVVAPSP